MKLQHSEDINSFKRLKSPLIIKPDFLSSTWLTETLNFNVCEGSFMITYAAINMYTSSL